MEMWHEPRSCSHYFMGTPVTWIHEHAAGLRRGADGWREFVVAPDVSVPVGRIKMTRRDRKSTRLNSSHVAISYAVFCLKKQTNKQRCYDGQRRNGIYRHYPL